MTAAGIKRQAKKAGRPLRPAGTRAWRGVRAASHETENVRPSDPYIRDCERVAHSRPGTAQHSTALKVEGLKPEFNVRYMVNH